LARATAGIGTSNIKVPQRTEIEIMCGSGICQHHLRHEF
jgi:hypothetical protein